MNKKNIGIAARLLEKYGYLKKVAGDNFDKACEVISMMHETGRGVIVSGPCGDGDRVELIGSFVERYRNWPSQRHRMWRNPLPQTRHCRK